MLQQLPLPPLLQLEIRNVHEWQLRSLHSGDKRMIQSLQRRHSLPRINLQYLLHKIDEEPNLPPLLYAIFKLWLFRTVSPNVKVLLLQFLNIFVLQQLHEVKKRVVSLRLFNVLVMLRRHLCHQKLGERFEVVPLLLRVEEEETITMS